MFLARCLLASIISDENYSATLLILLEFLCRLHFCLALSRVCVWFSTMWLCCGTYSGYECLCIFPHSEYIELLRCSYYFRKLSAIGSLNTFYTPLSVYCPLVYPIACMLTCFFLSEFRIAWSLPISLQVHFLTSANTNLLWGSLANFSFRLFCFSYPEVPFGFGF